MAFLLAPLILAYLALLGIGCAALFARRVPAGLVLCSPAGGVGILLALAFTLSRWGLPAQSFALALALVLGAAAAAAVAWRRPQIPWDELRALAPPVVAGMLLAGAPVLAYGFNWVADANPDMGLYVNSAANFLRHGFFDVPDVSALRANADAARNSWFWEVMPPNRYGADMLVALAAAVFRVPVYEIYMVVEVAAFGALVMAAGALVADLGSRLRAYLTVALIAVASPLMLYVVYQQLLPQLLGQVAMVALVGIVQTPAANGRAPWQRGVALGCAGTALLLTYPESSPVAALGGLVTAPFALYAHRAALRAFVVAAARVAGAAVLTVVVLLNVQLFTVAATFGTLFAIGSSVANEGVGALNYYLLPSGLANLWGLVPFDDFSEPWLTIAIVLGFVALLALLVAGARALPRGRLADGTAVGILLFVLYLFGKRSSYGLFKAVFLLVPFVFPFAAAAVAAAGELLRRRLRVRAPWSTAAALAVAVAFTAYSSYVYLGATSDAFARENAKFTELHAASADGLYAQLDRVERDYAGAAPVQFDTDVLLPNLATLQGAAFYGHPVSFVALDPFANMYGALRHGRVHDIPGWPRGSREAGLASDQARIKLFMEQVLRLGGERVGTWVPPPRARRADDVLIETGPKLTILNRSATPAEFDVRAVPLRDVRDRLSFVKSDLGFPPLTQLRSFAIGPVEPDPFDRSATVATLGTAILLEVINGAPSVRLQLDLTGTLNPDHVDDLPPVTVIGTSAVSVTGLGSGAARIVTPPVRPFDAFGRRYVVVRLGSRHLHFTTRRSWLMSLYGNDVDIQPRTFALYGRDVSIAGPAPTPPSALKLFPHDLLDRSLRFSGIFEDGWMSDSVRARLHAAPGGFLRLRANVPPGQPEHTIDITVDGKLVKSLIARPSTYVELQVRNPGEGDHDVALASSGVAPVSADDPRKTWARLQELSFEPDITGAGVELADEREWYPFETFANRTFRWTKRTVHLRVQPSRAPRVLRLDVAPGPSGGGKTDVTVSVAGRARTVHVAGEQQIVVDLPAGTKPLDVAVARPPGTLRVPNDPRDLTLRVFSAALAAR